MSNNQEKLLKLEAAMGRLCSLRASRINTAEQAIRHANAEFDRDALPLGRLIEKLRKQVEAETPAEKPVTFTVVRHEETVPDPDWSQEDIDHYNELRGGSVK